MSAEEMQMMQDTHFLLTKRRISDKIEDLLKETRTALKGALEQLDFDFPPDLPLDKGKISKGDNYRGLPYQVLDYPALYRGEDIFALRTMFWWGHHFSVTLHLQGAFLSVFRPRLLERFAVWSDDNLYWGVGASPWEYHYDSDNYLPLADVSINRWATHPFIKISRRVELDQWDQLSRMATDFLEKMAVALR